MKIIRGDSKDIYSMNEFIGEKVNYGVNKQYRDELEKHYNTYTNQLIEKKYNENELYRQASNNVRSILEMVKKAGGFLPIVCIDTDHVRPFSTQIQRYTSVWTPDFEKILDSVNPYEEILTQILILATEYYKF
jgi:hypothetical protein